MVTKETGKVHTFKAWMPVDKKTGEIIIPGWGWEVFVLYKWRANARDSCGLLETVKRVRVTVEVD